MEAGVKEKPIIFKEGSVRSILGRNKTQTRRVITRENSRVFSRLNPEDSCKVDEEFWKGLAWGNAENTPEGLRVMFDWEGDGVWRHFRPTWAVGQILWVKEAFWASHDMEGREYADPVDYGTRLGEDYYESGRESYVQYCATPQNPKSPGEPGEFIHQDYEDLDSEMHWTPWQHYSKQSPLFMPKWASRLWLKVVEVRPEAIKDLTIDDALAEGAEFDVCDHAWADHLGCTDCMNTGMLSDPRWDFRHLWDEINAKRGFPWEANPWVWVFTFEIIERPNLWPNRKIEQ